MTRNRGTWCGTVKVAARTVNTVDYGDGWQLPGEVSCILTGGTDDLGITYPDASFTYVLSDGAPRCVEVTITAKPGTREARPDFFTSADVASWGRRAFAASAERTAPATIAVDHALARAAGSNDRRSAELREVARVFLDPVNAARPALAVEELCGYGSPATANRRIKAARDAGLIPPVSASEDELRRAWSQVARKPDVTHGPDDPSLRSITNWARLNDRLGIGWSPRITDTWEVSNG